MLANECIESGDVPFTQEPGIEYARFVSLRPDDLEAYDSHISAMGPEDRALFRRLLSFVHENLLDDRHGAKLVRQYTGQARGGSNTPWLVYGILRGDRLANFSWVARISLEADPGIILPAEWLAVGARALVRQDEAMTSFSPIDTEHFLTNPARYLTESKP